MSNIQHIVFDIGRVLIHWDPELPYLDLIPDEDERTRFLNEVCNGAWNLEQDRGRSWKTAEDLLIADHPDKADLIRAYRKRWIQSVPYAYAEVVDIYQQLIRRNHDVTLLTNFNQDTYLEASGKYPFLNEARGETVSGRVQLIKPDKAIFAHHENAFDLDGERTVFIDDSAANIAAARDHGWTAIHFKGIDGEAPLKSALSNLKIEL